jgi:hypothetical protein
MTKTEKIHLIIISVINFSVIFKLVSSAWNGNDKGIILVIFGYTALTIINGIVWLIFKILKRPEKEIYKITSVGLILLFIPTVIISGLY